MTDKMTTVVENRVEQIERRLYKLDFPTFGRLTVSLPLGSLVFCFVTAVIFQYNEVNETVCNVQNMVPSISAITGVTPQRYIWRICIALHCTPRFIIGFIYYNYYMTRVHFIQDTQRRWYELMAKVNFWVYMIENSCLVGVTYIANVENYPVHEKIFVVFMVTSLLYELLTIIMFRWAHPEIEAVPHMAQSYQYKKVFFMLISCFTAGLLYFFIRHRFFCEPNAFSWFSFCEYGIAIVNILFHYTATIEFVGLHWFVGVPFQTGHENNGGSLHGNGTHNANNNSFITDHHNKKMK